MESPDLKIALIVAAKDIVQTSTHVVFEGKSKEVLESSCAFLIKQFDEVGKNSYV